MVLNFAPLREYIQNRIMNKLLIPILFIYVACACNESAVNKGTSQTAVSSLVNTSHLDHLYTPAAFKNGESAAGIYIYAEAPDYHLVADSDEGYTCVDDVARAALVYLRNNNLSTDTSTQKKLKQLIRFILQMQSGNGYFYNFLFPDSSINKTGKTSRATPDWWSWRALQTLTEASPLIASFDAPLAAKVNAAVNRLIQNIKSDLVNIPATTKIVNGIIVPKWLPAGSATDQTAIIILGLISYCEVNTDSDLTGYIKKLADGIAMMQQGDATQFPYSCFLSWEDVWHAYGNDQAYALFKAAAYLKDTTYAQKALAEVDNFYPWLLKAGMKSSFSLNKKDGKFVPSNEKEFEQIAYGIRPMVFAAIEAFNITGNQKYAETAGQLAAWFLGNNSANTVMYDTATGRCFDGIIAAGKVNKNSGAESTIEALLCFQKIEKYPAVISAINKFKMKK